jgi:hypothetical protein
MSTTERERRRAAIRATLARHAGDAPDPNAIAAATLTTWHQMAARLTPVIGVRGGDVLFGRALHLTTAAFPWLDMAGARADQAALLASLQARLAGQETAAVGAAAAAALLATFTELLATLIGESLTERLLGPVWIHSLPESEQERAS